ncbi:MAG: efflux RND transporter periplasmic adaptor subunit [Cyanobacteriota bacterium]
MLELQEKQKFKSGVRWLALSGALAVVSAGGWLVYGQTLHQSTQPIAVRLITVKQGNVELAINESGTVELGGQQQLKSPGEVTVDQVLVKVGDRIRFGQKLLILRSQQRETNLDNQNLEIRKQELQLTRSRQKVTEAQEQLALAQEELKEPVSQQFLIRKQELILERSQQKVAEAQEKLEAQKQKLQQLEVLAQKGFIPGNELQEQKEQVRNAEFAVRDTLTTVNTETLELQRLQAEGKRPTQLQDKVLDAQSQLQEARSEANTNSRELQRLQVEQESIQQQLQNNIVTAPISGMVLDLNVKDGDGVKPGDVLLTLGNPAQELVKLQLSTLDAAKVEVNQKARIKVIGPDAKLFSGRVKSIYPQAIAPDETQSSSRRQSAQAKVPAIIKLDAPTGTLIPGSQVSVEIIHDQRRNVLVVDPSAIDRSESPPFIWIRDDYGKAQKRSVILGLEGATSVEVKTGLRSGDRVILPPPDTALKPGMPVLPESNPPDLSSPPSKSPQ